MEFGENKMRKEVDEKKSEKLHEKLIKLATTIGEEFDILEAIEDNIKDAFHCDMECITCTEDERAICMQTFKKANLFWIRKIAQDERMLHDIVEKMDEYRELLKRATDFIKKNYPVNDNENDLLDSILDDSKSIDYDKRRKDFKKDFKSLYS